MIESELWKEVSYREEQRRRGRLVMDIFGTGTTLGVVPPTQWPSSDRMNLRAAKKMTAWESKLATDGKDIINDNNNNNNNNEEDLEGYDPEAYIDVNTLANLIDATTKLAKEVTLPHVPHTMEDFEAEARDVVLRNGLNTLFGDDDIEDENDDNNKGNDDKEDENDNFEYFSNILCNLCRYESIQNVLLLKSK